MIDVKSSFTTQGETNGRHQNFPRKSRLLPAAVRPHSKSSSSSWSWSWSSKITHANGRHRHRKANNTRIIVTTITRSGKKNRWLLSATLTTHAQYVNNCRKKKKRANYRHRSSHDSTNHTVSRGVEKWNKHQRPQIIAKTHRTSTQKVPIIVRVDPFAGVVVISCYALKAIIEKNVRAVYIHFLGNFFTLQRQWTTLCRNKCMAAASSDSEKRAAV